MHILKKRCFHRLLHTVCIAAILFSVLIVRPIFFFRMCLTVVFNQSGISPTKRHCSQMRTRTRNPNPNPNRNPNLNPSSQQVRIPTCTSPPMFSVSFVLSLIHSNCPALHYSPALSPVGKHQWRCACGRWRHSLHHTPRETRPDFGLILVMPYLNLTFRTHKNGRVFICPNWGITAQSGVWNYVTNTLWESLLQRTFQLFSKIFLHL